jgi:hypothetical protein
MRVCGPIRADLCTIEHARVLPSVVRVGLLYGRSGICSTWIRVPTAVPRRPERTTVPAGSRSSEIDTALNVSPSFATYTVALTFYVPR